jgi:phenylacetate-CoA ligase
MDLYATLVDRVLFPTWEGTVRGRPTVTLQHHLERSQWRSRDELEAMQMGALRRLLVHAWANVPFWRARMDAIGMRPEDVRSLEDYRKLSVVDRAALRDGAESRVSTAPPFPTISKTTSGSTSEPLVVRYDAGSEHWRQATKYRGYGWAGYRVGVRTLHYWGMGNPPTGWKRAKISADRALRRERWINCNRRGEEELSAVAEEIRKDPPEVMLAFSQAAADLARFVIDRRIRCPEMTVICAAERLLPADREVIAQAFGARVFETYGSREVMLIGAECEAHDGMHLSMENLLVEIIVRGENGAERLAEPGESGEVVLTDLHNHGMPLLRYASGDYATAMGRETCTCGRGLARISGVDGRVAETLVDGEGGRVSGLLVVVAVVYAGDGVKAFQLVQHRDRAVTIRLVVDALGPELEAKLRALVEPHLRGVPIRFERVPEIPLAPSGKRQLVIVER